MLIVMGGRGSKRHRVVESIDEYHHRTACGRVLDGPSADREKFPPNCRSCHLALD